MNTEIKNKRKTSMKIKKSIIAPIIKDEDFDEETKSLLDS